MCSFLVIFMHVTSYLFPVIKLQRATLTNSNHPEVRTEQGTPNLIRVFRKFWSADKILNVHLHRGQVIISKCILLQLYTFTLFVQTTTMTKIRTAAMHTLRFVIFIFASLQINTMQKNADNDGEKRDYIYIIISKHCFFG